MRASVIIPIAVTALLLPAASLPAQNDWPQFLGPNRNGISAETGLIDSIPAGGPKEVWRISGGVGMSGLAISRGKLLTMVQKDGQQFLTAKNAETGAPLWETPLSSQYENQQGNGPRATPTIAGEKVYTYTGEGVLVCLNFADGKLVWKHDVPSELKGKPADYGMACSPLIVGKNVLVAAGAPQAAVAAYDGESGKLAWTAGDDPAGYSSPALLDVGGQKQIVVFTGASAIGLAPEKGTLLWRYPYETDYDANIATPLAHRGQIFLSSGENHGSVLLGLRQDGERFVPREMWTSQGASSKLRNEWQTSMLLDNHLYGFDNVGSAGPVTHLTCVEVATGKPTWQQARFGKGNLIAADGKLFISTMKGELVIVRATPKAYEELGRATVLGSTRQAPSLANGRLFLRDDKDIVCLDVRK